jgi:hypothetical protein
MAGFAADLTSLEKLHARASLCQSPCARQADHTAADDGDIARTLRHDSDGSIALYIFVAAWPKWQRRDKKSLLLKIALDKAYRADYNRFA